jgi:hypothetical protein
MKPITKKSYTLKYYPGSNENSAENIAAFPGLKIRPRLSLAMVPLKLFHG